MKILNFKKYFNILIDLRFAIIILIVIAIVSSLGSFIEQDETMSFYKENYSSPIYGFIDYSFILNSGIDHIYRTWWFLFLLNLLAISLIGCTINRQFPLLINSKEYFFKEKSFSSFLFFVKIKSLYYLKEFILLKINSLHFYFYQKKNLLYGYRGLIGRISPILVHLSLLFILFGSSIGAFLNFKAQEIIPKGEIFQIQNPIKVGYFTAIPNFNIRVNDFWIEYNKQKIHQFYTNLSILDNYANEVKQQSISVNNPFRYKNLDIYQSDWNLSAIRLKTQNLEKKKSFSSFLEKEILEIKKKNQIENIYEYPLYSLKKDSKIWITWIKVYQKKYIVIFDQLQDSFSIYDEKGKYLRKQKTNENNDFFLTEIIPSTGLLIKYDPSIPIIYFGFGGLIITTVLSYLPYTQIWILSRKKNSWIGSNINRRTIHFEIEFENFLRDLEKGIYSSKFNTKKKK
jgi:cytochrome c biogenesis protein